MGSFRSLSVVFHYIAYVSIEFHFPHWTKAFGCGEVVLTAPSVTKSPNNVYYFSPIWVEFSTELRFVFVSRSVIDET